mgnify:CR=1 FL=1
MTKSEKTRQFIVDKAAVLFNQSGYAGTSMDDIMKATNLSKGALYGNFKSKDEIAVAAFDRAVAIVSNEVRERTRVIEHALDKLKAVVYFYKERILNPPVEGGCPIQNTSVEADDAHPELREKAIQAMNMWTDRISRTLQNGIERGEVRPDVDKAAFAIRFIGTLEGGIMMARLYKDVHYFDVMSRQLIEMIDEIREK